MAWTGAEGPADAAITYINDNAATKFDAVDSRYSDNITLADLAAVHLADDMADLNELPALLVNPVTVRPDQRAPGGMKRGYIAEARIMFTLFFELLIDESGSGIDNAETLKRTATRYGVALLELLAEGSGTGAGATGYEWGTGAPWTLSYGPSAPVRDRTSRAAFIALEIGVRQSEAAL